MGLSELWKWKMCRRFLWVCDFQPSLKAHYEQFELLIDFKIMETLAASLWLLTRSIWVDLSQKRRGNFNLEKSNCVHSLVRFTLQWNVNIESDGTASEHLKKDTQTAGNRKKPLMAHFPSAWQLSDRVIDGWFKCKSGGTLPVQLAEQRPEVEVLKSRMSLGRPSREGGEETVRQ